MNTKTYFVDIGAGSPSLRSYGSGFLLSLLLTLGAYVVVVHHLFSYAVVTVMVIALACIQFIVQIVCFLHLGREAASRERLVILACAAVVVCILVTGSIWIMFTLNQRMMPDTAQMNQYMDSQAGM